MKVRVPRSAARPGAPAPTPRARVEADLAKVKTQLAGRQGWSPPLRAASLAQQDVARRLAKQLEASPSAAFVTLSAPQQRRAQADVQRALTAACAGAPMPAARRAALTGLIAKVGAPDFYLRLAEAQPQDAAKWTQMAQVQQQFAAAEAGYDPTTRAYSESMRLTLHAAVLQHFAQGDTGSPKPLYERFIELHPTAFHENGGWVDNLQIPLSGAQAVAQATPMAMLLNAADLAQGAFATDAPTVKAAQWVREARLAAANG